MDKGGNRQKQGRFSFHCCGASPSAGWVGSRLIPLRMGRPKFPSWMCVETEGAGLKQKVLPSVLQAWRALCAAVEGGEAPSGSLQLQK